MQEPRRSGALASYINGMRGGFLRIAVSTESLVAEDFIDSRERDQHVDNHHDVSRQIIAEAVTEHFESPVETADDKQDERNRMDFHKLD
ncbi:MAG: hypothetical protein UY54_C0017G0004 [Parcubacteria group bacterium GW2011_GWA2_50_10b]|nr:MAG: hypothetical protein UY54_C0017G0004 [Parcubacteria group bacterium GW2011_GWA2_50_10b]